MNTDHCCDLLNEGEKLQQIQQDIIQNIGQIPIDRNTSPILKENFIKTQLETCVSFLSVSIAFKD